MENCRYDAGHMTEVAAMLIYGKKKKLSKIFSGTSGPAKLCMQHCGLFSVIVCSDDDPGSTLTYFTTRSNFVKLAFL